MADRRLATMDAVKGSEWQRATVVATADNAIWYKKQLDLIYLVNDKGAIPAAGLQLVQNIIPSRPVYITASLGATDFRSLYIDTNGVLKFLWDDPDPILAFSYAFSVAYLI